MLILDFGERASKDAYHSLLPPFLISDKLKIEINKSYLDFVTCFFVSSKEDLLRDSQVWFLDEIAVNLKLVYPDMTKQAIVNTLHQIMQMSITKEKK
jgi:hypothetical protein